MHRIVIILLLAWALVVAGLVQHWSSLQYSLCWLSVTSPANSIQQGARLTGPQSSLAVARPSLSFLSPPSYLIWAAPPATRPGWGHTGQAGDITGCHEEREPGEQQRGITSFGIWSDPGSAITTASNISWRLRDNTGAISLRKILKVNIDQRRPFDISKLFTLWIISIYRKLDIDNCNLDIINTVFLLRL